MTKPTEIENNYRYPGIRPFNSEQGNIFYGRKEEVESLYRLISLQKEILLYGKSGLGKSSLINAGIIPRIEKDGKYLCLLIRFGGYSPGKKDTPLDILKTLVKRSYSPAKMLPVEQVLPKDISLWRVLKDHQLSTGNNQLVLIFDQFEELFTYPKEQITAFKSELSEALYSEIPQRYRDHMEEALIGGDEAQYQKMDEAFATPMLAKTLFVIREDKMSLLNELVSHIPNILKNNFQVSALNRSQTEEAILNPAFQQDPNFISPVFDIENQAIEHITSYLTKNSTQLTEPFQLQILCESIEQKVIQKSLSSVTIEDIRDIDEVYENYYENQLLLVEESERQVARNLIEAGLIDAEEERRKGLYEKEMRNLYGISSQLLDKLINTRLIRAVKDARGGKVYELCHDSLIQPILKARQEREGHQVSEELAQVKRDFSSEKQKRKVWQWVSLLSLFLLLVAAIVYMQYENRALKEVNEKTSDALNTSRSLGEANAQRAKANKLTSAALVAGKQDKTVELNLLERALEVDPENTIASNVRNELLNSSFSFPFYKHSLLGHQDYVIGVKTLPQSGRIITVSGDSIHFWSPNGKLEKTVHTGNSRTNSFDVSPSGSQIVTGGMKGEISLWNTDGKLLKAFPRGHGALITQIRFLDENRIISGGWDTKGKLWYTNGAQIGNSFDEHSFSIECIAVSPSKKMFLLGSEGLHSFSVRTLNDSIVGMVDSLSHRVTSAAFIEINRFDSTFLITGLLNGMVQYWDKNLKPVFSMKAHDRKITKIICLGQSFLTSSEDRTIKEWNYEGTLLKTFQGHEDAVVSLDVDEKNKVMISGSQDGTAKIWIRKEYSSATIQGHRRRISALDFDSEGTSFISGSWDSWFKIWNLTGTQLGGTKHSSQQSNGAVRLTKFVSNDKYVMTGGTDMKIKIWDRERLRSPVAFTLGQHVYDGELSHKGDFLVGVGGHEHIGIAKIWDTSKGFSPSEGIDLKGHTMRINEVDISPNDSLILTVSDDKHIILWDRKGQQIHKFKGSTDRIKTAAFSPDGQYIFSGGWDNRIRKWDLNGKLLKVFLGHESDVNTLIILPKQQLLLSGSSDKKIKLWNFDGIQQPNYMEMENSVYAIAISPDEKRVLTGGKDNSIKIWELDNIERILENVADLPDTELRKYGYIK